MDSEEKQIIALMKEENDEAIVAVCKEIDWSKEQSSYVELAMQSACENTGNIETEYNIRLAQYKNWRSDRYILYQVVSLAIRLGKLDEADEFFAEYQNKYGLTDVAGTCCLDYELRSAEGASDDELIDILEDVYRAEADVKYMYELAKLYSGKNWKEACVLICDEIIDIGGQYAVKAEKLKNQITGNT